ncbi:MAG: hypothetical protein MJ102_04510 [Clostridia bacterium]|nr:hypothetical protein [Clostridia bacterium]
MKNNYKVEVKLSDELMRKLLVISREEGRSVNNQFVFMLRNNIQYYERTKGRIDPKVLASEDISAYRDTDSAEKTTETGDNGC